MSHIKRACDTYIPLLSRRSDSLPHSSRIIIVYEDGNFSEVSKLGECSGFSELYLVVTSVSTEEELNLFGIPSTKIGN